MQVEEKNRQLNEDAETIEEKNELQTKNCRTMKVCKFDKIEDEDKINRIIKYIINENPYVIAIPPLLPLEEKAREISIGWFREDNETVRSAIKSIEYYCYARVDRLTANVELQRNIKEIISTRIKNMYAWTENKAE